MRKVLSIVVLTLCCTLVAAQSYTFEDSLKAIQVYVARQYADAWIELCCDEDNYIQYQSEKNYSRGNDKIDFVDDDLVSKELVELERYGGMEIYDIVMKSSYMHGDWHNPKKNINGINVGLKYNLNITSQQYEALESKMQIRQDKICQNIDVFLSEGVVKNEVVDDTVATTKKRNGSIWFLIGGIILGVSGIVFFILGNRNKKRLKPLVVPQSKLSDYPHRVEKIGQVNKIDNIHKDEIVASKDVQIEKAVGVKKVDEVTLMKQDLPKEKVSPKVVKTKTEPKSIVKSSKGNSVVVNSKPTKKETIAPLKDVTDNVQPQPQEVKQEDTQIKKEPIIRKVYATFGENQILEICSNYYDAYYVLTINMDTPNDAEFEFCGDVVYALRHRDVILDGFCYIKNNFGNSKVNTLQKGKAINRDNRWYVVKRAVIEIV